MKTPLVKQTLRILVICLAVGALLLLRRPPKSGNAAITGTEEGFLGERQTLQRWTFSPIEVEEEVTKTNEVLPVADELKNESIEETAVEEIFEDERAAFEDEPTTFEDEPAIIKEDSERQEITPTVGVVDARRCFGLNYLYVMHGAVSTRMVWNGQTFVPQKVCVVKEGEGVASIWSFEQRGRAILSEALAGSEVLRHAAGNPSAKPNE